MNESDHKTTDTSEVAELKEHYNELCRLVTVLLVGAVVGSITITGFIGLQNLRANRDLNAVQYQLEQTTDAMAKQLPSIEAFTSKLVEYGRTHPDFAPIVAKYGLTNAPGPVPLGSKK